MQKKRGIATGLFLIFLIAPMAWAGYHGEGRYAEGYHGKRFSEEGRHHKGYSHGRGFHATGPRTGRGPLAALHGLNLGEAQVEQIASVLAKYKDAHALLRRQVRDARKQLQNAIRSESFDEANVREAARALGEQITETAVHRARVFSEIRPVLTEEQIAQLETLKETKCERRENHRRLNQAIHEYQCPYAEDKDE